MSETMTAMDNGVQMLDIMDGAWCQKDKYI